MEDTYDAKSQIFIKKHKESDNKKELNEICSVIYKILLSAK
jgi:hypothetical protein